MLKSRPSRINRRRWGSWRQPGFLDGTVLPLLRRTASRLPAFPHFITSGLPSYTGADEEVWGLAALLHDFDYERWPNHEHSPDQGHPSEGAKILREMSYSEEIVRAILSHADYCHVPRQSALEHTLFACDELAGFLTACAYVRPSKSILDLEVDSVKRRMKDKLFAKGVSREDMRKGAEELGVALEEHIAFSIRALREHAEALGLRGSL